MAALGIETFHSFVDPVRARTVIGAGHHGLAAGRPNGIGDGNIPSLTRLVTVADIYAALVEERPGKPGLTPAKAYEHLTKLGRRLDRNYVSKFKAVALAQAA